MKIDINVFGLSNTSNMVSPNIVRALERSVFETAGFLENKRTLNINKKVYSRPESEDYKRTGRALGGTSNQSLDGGLTRKVINDTRIKGAKKNYAPFLNRNKKIPSLNTQYWDLAVIDTKKHAIRILKRNLGKNK